ncbi:hypothetical protein C8R44DRAFT_981525 [Mycena epipterygia]|nr:hypothetical protein C8R44DRAFT_981525 [Mycena epipterygia]
MPVTFTVACHAANPVTIPSYLPQPASYTPRQVLDLACEPQAKKAGEILQSSLNDEPTQPSEPDLPEPKRERKGGRWRRFLPSKSPPMKVVLPPTIETTSRVIPTRNGLVYTVILAYNKHHALVLRPDDVWLAILTQFNFFVNANAELLRASFVAHEGKRELLIEAEGTRYTVDFGEISRQMVDQLEKNVVDPGLRAWVLPTFTTTTENDTTVAAMLMMATLKAYFSYTFDATCCGIPRVTLEGNKADWEAILGRLEKLKEYGLQTIAWYHLLVPVISRFVKSFDEPKSPATVKFWQQKGKWIGHQLRTDLERPEAPETLSPSEFIATYVNATRWGGGDMQLILDNVPFHQVDCEMTPPSYAEVDVKLQDNGLVFDCSLTAGLVGTRICSSKDITLSVTGKDDTVTPLLGWWMFIKK